MSSQVRLQVRGGSSTSKEGTEEEAKAVQRTGECTIGCGACCVLLTINVNPDYYKSADAKAWVELHAVNGRHIRVRMKDGICWMDIPIQCSALTDDGMCSLMGKPERPKSCDDFPTSQADINLVDEFAGEKVCTYSFLKGGDE